MADRHPTDILIIDDTEANRYVISRILTNAAYHVREAASCAMARDAMRETLPQLIILDVQLPDGNGYDFCQALKSDPALCGIPILMTSAAFTQAQDRATGLDRGADGYLTTPVNALELTATVRSLLRVREAEEKLRLALLKAEEASNAKTEFLANMSHEIRTPMNAIIGLANIMATTPLTDKQTQYMTTLQFSAEGLLTLINDMLDVSKIEDNMIELETIPFSTAEIITYVMDMMAVRADEKALRLEVDDRCPQHRRFLGDPHRLQQVLINLVSNAIKFTPTGTITLKAWEEGTGETRDLFLEITDTGIGIPLEKQMAVFEKFTQVDSSISRKFGGSGLGLSISKALIERMGGTISLRSAPDEGSSFTIRLSLPGIDTPDAAHVSVPASAPEARASAEIRTVLLVEDYAANIMVATIVLEDAGYQCEVATSGEEALAKLAARRFGAVLMDIQMHGMDGFETTKRIRAWETEHAQTPVPIIAVTAHAVMGYRDKCLDAGMNDYISKPFNPQELKQKISSLYQADLPA